jgi:tRNA(adenine34) deaminase
MTSRHPSRARFLTSCAAFSAAPAIAQAAPSAGQIARHERYMREAIREAKRNPKWPFGAVIVDSGSGEILARGSNASSGNPILHGEIVAISDYVARHGNRNWSRTTIYTTAEPCSMCASAIVWCAIPRVVYGSSTLVVEAMIDQISVRAAKIFAGAPFYRNSLLLGGVLAAETDTMLRNRVK